MPELVCMRMQCAESFVVGAAAHNACCPVVIVKGQAAAAGGSRPRQQ